MHSAHNALYVFFHRQINDPIDGQIAGEIVSVAESPTSPDCMPIDLAKRLGRLQYLGEEMFQSYIETVSLSVPPFDSISQGKDTAESRSQFGISYTPLHGVGAHIAEQLFHRRGFKSVRTVVEQREPDGDFPTVNFPSKCILSCGSKLTWLANHFSPSKTRKSQGRPIWSCR
jgi:phosphomannomutase